LTERKVFARDAGSGDWTTVHELGEGSGASLEGIASSGGRIVVVATDSTLVSEDGLSWQIFPQADLFEAVSNVIYGNEEFLAPMETFLARSEDGIEWTYTSVPGYQFSGVVVYGGDAYVAE